MKYQRGDLVQVCVNSQWVDGMVLYVEDHRVKVATYEDEEWYDEERIRHVEGSRQYSSSVYSVYRIRAI